jgi:hypothetical protein
MNWFMAKPEILNVPLFRQYLEDNDISPFKLSGAELQQVEQSGGGQQPQMEPKQDQLFSAVNQE